MDGCFCQIFTKVIFLHLFVILFTEVGGVCSGGGVVSQYALRRPQSRHPPGADTSQEQTPPEQTPPPQSRPPQEHTPPRADTPQSRQPPEQADTPSGADTPPRVDTTPPRSRTPPEADSGIRSTSGRYASYWNAFLFVWFLLPLGLCDIPLIP